MITQRKCDECGLELVPVGPGSEDHDQFHEALPLHLDGGYGMFFDWPLNKAVHIDETSNMAKIILCHDCAHMLARVFPNSIGKIVKDGHMATNAHRNGFPNCSW